MSIRNAALLLILVAIAAGGWALHGMVASEPTQLVPAWRLLEPQRYRGMSQLDPFVSWSPDSRSLLFSEFSYKGQTDKIYRWDVGENEITEVTSGASPNFTGKNRFIYLKKEPKSIIERSLTTGEEKEIMPAVTGSEFWGDVAAINYNPEKNTVALRLVEITRHYTPGSEEFDMEGRWVGDIPTRMADGIVDFSGSPDGSKCAILVQESVDQPVSLQIADEGQKRGKVVATGHLGAVAWSPSGEIFAYGESTNVVAVRPGDGKRVVIGRFGAARGSSQSRHVTRLSWSPNSQYLAVLVYVPDISGDYPIIYVLDMSRFNWER